MLYDISARLAALATVTVWDTPTEKKMGRPPKPPGEAATPAQRDFKRRSKRKFQRTNNIAVLDTETDPFNNQTQARILPFLAVLYSDNFEPVVIWEENQDAFVSRVIAAIEALPEPYTIYAHNGGKFDFLFFVHRLRGDVQFKGRGIMSARIGPHELRDSFDIIPERLAAWHKEAFDYKKLERKRRANHKQEAIDYCLSDCKYLLSIVKGFIGKFGLKLTIGQAAMYELKKHYPDIARFSEGWDDYMRGYFFGGRVECLRGRGHFRGDYKLFDLNSQYPFVMATYEHPIGGFFDYQLRVGDPGPDTCFIDLECNNRGALIARAESGETTAGLRRGRFKTSVWEYNVALRHGLIDDVKINYCVDCNKRTTFEKHVIPIYENRLISKATLQRLKSEGAENSEDFMNVKKDDMFYKFLLNTGYGKFAQNPRNFKEHHLTDPDEMPPDAWFKSIRQMPAEQQSQYMLPVFESADYWIWQKPNPGFRFNNVGTAASITGAARAVLLEALQTAEDAIYCDTDSIICKALPGVTIDRTRLGAWDMEDEFSAVIINGKKLYSVMHAKPKVRTTEELQRGLDPCYTVKSKGSAGISWPDMVSLLNGGTVIKVNRAPTLTKFGQQHYISRTIRATAPELNP